LKKTFLGPNVETTEVGRETIVSQKLIGGVDIVHVMHSTESEILLNVVGLVHPGSDRAHEGEDLVPAALLILGGEILAGKFGDPDRFPEGRMEVGNIVDELLRVGTIPMESNGVDLATFAVCSRNSASKSCHQER